MSAPNRYGSNKAKAIIVMPIDEGGEPIGPTNPAQVQVIYNGEPVSSSNPLPAVAIIP